MKDLEWAIESAGTGFAASYAMAVQPGLSILAGASGAYGFVTSAKTIAQILVKMDLGNATAEGAKAVLREERLCKGMSGRLELLQLYRLTAVALDLAVFAVTSAVLHPLLTLP